MPDYFYRKVQPRICPGLRFSQWHYGATLERFVQHGWDWLDLGCGHQILPEWMLRQEQELAARSHSLIGVDLDFPGLRKHRTIRLRAMADLNHLPLTAGSFDVVTANMVMEHVGDPEAVLREARRVLRPGGLFIFHTPNLRHPAVCLSARLPDRLKKPLIEKMEGRRAEDVFPTLYRINSPRAIAHYARESGFQVLELNCVNNAPRTAAFGPLVLPELLLIRLLNWRALAQFRETMITVLQKPMPSNP